jgi:hypothetical protein
MTNITVTSQATEKRTFAGRAWKNVSKGGKSYINGTFDRGFAINGVDLSGVKFQLFDNVKRDGKKDADLRLSILTQ